MRLLLARDVVRVHGLLDQLVLALEELHVVRGAGPGLRLHAEVALVDPDLGVHDVQQVAVLERVPEVLAERVVGGE